MTILTPSVGRFVLGISGSSFAGWWLGNLLGGNLVQTFIGELLFALAVLVSSRVVVGAGRTWRDVGERRRSRARLPGPPARPLASTPDVVTIAVIAIPLGMILAWYSEPIVEAVLRFDKNVLTGGPIYLGVGALTMFVTVQVLREHIDAGERRSALAVGMGCLVAVGATAIWLNGGADPVAHLMLMEGARTTDDNIAAFVAQLVQEETQGLSALGRSYVGLLLLIPGMLIGYLAGRMAASAYEVGAVLVERFGAHRV